MGLGELDQEMDIYRGLQSAPSNHKLLIAINDSKECRAALAWATGTLIRTGDQVLLYHAVKTPALIPTAMGMLPYTTASPEMQRAHISVAVEQATALLRSFQAYCRGKQVNANVEVERCDERHVALIAKVEREGITHLVMGDRSQSTFPFRLKSQKPSLGARICQDAPPCHVILVDKKKRATFHSKAPSPPTSRLSSPGSNPSADLAWKPSPGHEISSRAPTTPSGFSADAFGDLERSMSWDSAPVSPPGSSTTGSSVFPSSENYRLRRLSMNEQPAKAQSELGRGFPGGEELRSSGDSEARGPSPVAGGHTPLPLFGSEGEDESVDDYLPSSPSSGSDHSVTTRRLSCSLPVGNHLVFDRPPRKSLSPTTAQIPKPPAAKRPTSSREKQALIEHVALLTELNDLRKRELDTAAARAARAEEHGRERYRALQREKRMREAAEIRAAQLNARVVELKEAGRAV